MNEPVKVVISAINGYGHYYLKTLLEETDCGKVVLAGIVDPEAERSKYYPALTEFCIPVCSMMNDFYLAGGRADLAVIASPPHFHFQQGIVALQHGTNVLCEKPVSGELSEAEALAEKCRKTGNFVLIGYQWSYSEGIRLLKKDILSGRFGKPLRMKSLCLWPREHSYFSRNNWAYRKYDPGGRVVKDNLFNNAMSHFIHNMLFLLGGTMDSSAEASEVEALTGRAYPIETYDTGSFRAVAAGGAELLFLGSHSAGKTVNPCFRIECEKGFAELKSDSDTIIAKTIGREEFSYPSPDSDHQFRKLFSAIEKAAGSEIEGCPVDAALPHARLVDEVEKKCPDPFMFPDKALIIDDRRIYVNGLDDILLDCYRNFTLPPKGFLI